MLGIDVLIVCPPESHVDDLVPAADSEDGDLSVGGQFYQREIELISGGINTSKRGERLLVPVQRINIPTSGKHQSVECFDGLPERFDVVMHGK